MDCFFFFKTFFPSFFFANEVFFKDFSEETKLQNKNKGEVSKKKFSTKVFLLVF